MLFTVLDTTNVEDGRIARVPDLISSLLAAYPYAAHHKESNTRSEQLDTALKDDHVRVLARLLTLSSTFFDSRYLSDKEDYRNEIVCIIKCCP
jgi:hypothetical protein